MRQMYCVKLLRHCSLWKGFKRPYFCVQCLIYAANVGPSIRHILLETSIMIHYTYLSTYYHFIFQVPNVPCNENGHFISSPPHSAQPAGSPSCLPTPHHPHQNHHQHVSPVNNHCNINPTSKPMSSGNLLVDTRPHNSGKNHNNSHKSYQKMPHESVSVETTTNVPTAKRVVEVYPT